MHILKDRGIFIFRNTPVIIKYPFWATTADEPKAVYACINYNEACCPEQIEGRSSCINGDAEAVFRELNQF